MHFFSTVLALAAVPAAVFGATQTVTVGEGGQLAFNPPNITAAVGDMVSFEFQAKNHSVTQSTFASPCTKAMINGSTGINSGFLAVPANATNGSSPTWTIQVMNTTPLWFYCAQKIPKAHCPAGMVFSINATPQKSHAAFVAAAMASGNSTAAGGDASGVAPAASSGAAASTGASGTAAAAVAASPSQAASSVGGSTVNANGACKAAFARGAAGLLTVAAIGAVLL